VRTAPFGYGAEKLDDSSVNLAQQEAAATGKRKGGRMQPGYQAGQACMIK
jgi:hypothetical protein